MRTPLAASLDWDRPGGGIDWRAAECEEGILDGGGSDEESRMGDRSPISVAMGERLSWMRVSMASGSGARNFARAKDHTAPRNS